MWLVYRLTPSGEPLVCSLFCPDAFLSPMLLSAGVEWYSMFILLKSSKETRPWEKLIYYKKLAYKKNQTLTALLGLNNILSHIKHVFTTSFGLSFYIFNLLLWRQSHIFSCILSPDGIAVSSLPIWSSLASNSKTALSIKSVKPNYCSRLFLR